MKYTFLFTLLFIVFSCSNNESPGINNTHDSPQASVQTASGENILPPNETTTKAEQEFADELNTLLNTVEETPHE